MVAGRRRGGVGLFTVIKTASLAEGKLAVKLRLVFDQWFETLSWERPHWAGLAGPGAFAALGLDHMNQAFSITQ